MSGCSVALRIVFFLVLVVDGVAFGGCLADRGWEAEPVAVWETMASEYPEDAPPYWQLYYGMSQSEVEAVMGQPRRLGNDLRLFRRFRIPRQGEVLSWAIDSREVYAIIEHPAGVLRDLLLARAGTRKAVSVIGSRAERLGQLLKPGTDEYDIIRLLGPPDNIFIWPDWVPIKPDMMGKLVFEYFSIRNPSASTLFFIDPKTHRLLEESSHFVRVWSVANEDE
jgi:hypothetical protein